MPTGGDAGRGAPSPRFGEGRSEHDTGPHPVSAAADGTAAATIRRLQASLDDRLAPSLPARGAYALLDYPDHRNIGDHAIWLGELAYLRRRVRRSPAYVCSRKNLDPSALRRLPANTRILLHGGGNFGDLWPQHQQFREDVLAAFPDRPIVQLPQSIHFSSTPPLTRAQRIIWSHRNFTLFVRDERSLAFARSHFDCAVSLCPDMAFALGEQRRPRPPSRDVLLMLRTDKERACDAAATDGVASAFGPPQDWVTFGQPHLATEATLSQRTAAKLLRRTPFVSDDYRRRRTYRVRSTQMVRCGLEQLATARCVVTDRLHVHILCILLDLHHVCLDNSYGKIANFYRCWTSDYASGAQAKSLPEAIEQAQAFLAV